jgi:hypothetical protein
MNVGIFVPTNNAEHARMLAAFAEGLARIHVKAEVYEVTDYHPVDVAIVFGVGKKSVPVSWPRGRVIQEQRARGKKVIVIEKGFVRRDEYYMAGFNALNGRADFYNANSPSDRWEALDVTLAPLREPADNQAIVVCGQVPSDASVQNVDIIAWCGKCIAEIRKRTKRQIIFRAHPLAKKRTPAMLGAINSDRSYEEDLKNAWAVVTFNSNAAVEAVIAGVPAFSFDRGSMALPVTSQTLNLIETPYFPEDKHRKTWASNLAYTQWNEDEFRLGMPWMHLMSKGFKLRAS